MPKDVRLLTPSGLPESFAPTPPWRPSILSCFLDNRTSCHERASDSKGPSFYRQAIPGSDNGIPEKVDFLWSFRRNFSGKGLFISRISLGALSLLSLMIVPLFLLLPASVATNSVATNLKRPSSTTQKCARHDIIIAISMNDIKVLTPPRSFTRPSSPSPSST